MIGNVCFAENLFPFISDERIGFVNEAGKIVIKPEFDEALPFSEGFAAVCVDGKYNFMNEKGLYPFTDLPKSLCMVNFFHNKFAVIGENSNGKIMFGYMDTKGKIIIPCQYKEANSFKSGMAVVMNFDNKYGVITDEGLIALPFDYQCIAPGFSEDKLITRKDEQSSWTVLDTKFKEAFSVADIDFLDSFSGGMAILVKNGKYGFVDEKGNPVIENKYAYAWPFSEGLASVSSDEGCGYINTSGDVIIPLTFQNAMPFAEGLAAVKRAGKWGYISSDGKMVIECKYNFVGSFQNGLALASTDDKHLYINKNGGVVFEF